MRVPSDHCFILERQEVCRAFSRAWAKTGKRIAARMAMIAITTRSSISVNPASRRFMGVSNLARRRVGKQADDLHTSAVFLHQAFPGNGAYSCLVRPPRGRFTNI